MSPDEMIAVIEAHKQGKRIEIRSHMCGSFWNRAPFPNWDFMNNDYRISREPRHAWFKEIQYTGPSTNIWVECSKGDCGAVEFVEVVR